LANLFVDLRFAVMSLVEHRRRTALLGGAIAAVTALFVLMGALSAGVDESLLDSATALATGHVNVLGFYKIGSAQPTVAVVDYPKIAKVVERAVPEMDFWVERTTHWATIVGDTGSMGSSVTGIELAREPKLSAALHIVSGDIAGLARPNSILLFEGPAKKLGVSVGDAVTLSAQTLRGVANTIDCRVVAIARDMGIVSRWSSFVSAATARSFYQLAPDVTTVMQIHLRHGTGQDVDVVSTRLRAALGAAGYHLVPPAEVVLGSTPSFSSDGFKGQALTVNTWKDTLSSINWTLRAINALSGVLTLVLSAIVVAGVMNSLWVSIRERTREIGTLRAIGMQRGSVRRMFLFEATLLAFASSAGGAVAGTVAAYALNAANIQVPLAAQIFLMRDTISLAVEPRAIVWVVALLTLVTGLAALYPASKAAGLKPADAMSHFG
jgi:ABC-type lipoprotein release transport system permease subunit